MDSVTTSLCQIRDLSDESFNSAVADDVAWGTVEDIWSQFRRYREESPVVPGEYRALLGMGPDGFLADRPHFSAFGYSEVEQILIDPVTWSSEDAHGPSTEKAFGRMLVVMDPPDHTRYRKVLQAAFGPRIVQGWARTLIAPIINHLIDQFAGDGRADLVPQFTIRYPFEAVYTLLDLPPDDVEVFYKLAGAQTMVSAYPDAALEAGRNLGEYLACLIAERRKRPGDDLVSQLITVEVDGQKVPDELMISFLRHILNAAADTTYRTTGALLIGLLTEPANLQMLRDDRALIPKAIDEALRWDGPIVANFRAATRPVTLAGVDIPAGAIVHTVQGSANHDDTRFPDPERFDILRSQRNRSFAFGTGPHLCIGMHLAKLQMAQALSALLDRLPGLRLDPDQPVPRMRGVNFRSTPSIPVLFDAP